mmetsp:Transcript_62254/g.103461  ORF Transcript_62254/g.103461 Transcript_62254/m.103461 type:complete len:210 (+) Transcript_62254:253-882(+)
MCSSKRICIQQNLINHQLVIRVQIVIRLHMIANLEPLHLCSIITSMHIEHECKLRVAMVVHCHRLHPRIVGVSRVIHIPTVHLTPILLSKELFGEVFKPFALFCRNVASLLRKFSSQRSRHQFTSIDHPTWDCPVPRVFPFDDDHLERPPFLLCVPPGDDGIRRVVRAPFAEGTAVRHASAPDWITGPACVRLEEEFVSLLRQLVGASF